MPNIMICGYKKDRADKLKQRIDIVMQKMDLAEDAITSIVTMRAESCDGKRTPMPYLQLCGTDRKELLRIIRAFKKNGIRADIEWSQIDGFVAAKDMV